MTRKIRTAVVGVGNCCSALVQGVTYYSKRTPNVFQHREIGGYLPSDIEFVAAFDIDSRKVNRDLSEAIFSRPNNAPKSCDIPGLNVRVSKGPVLDGTSGPLSEIFEVSPEPETDISRILTLANAEVVVNFLPTGCDRASMFYMEEALNAGCGFINATPTPMASESKICTVFEKSSLPIAGDDVMSQIGGTILHKNLLEFLAMRGIKILNSYQLDVGGGAENLNTLDEDRKALKGRIKSSAVKGPASYDAQIVTGTTDYVDFMNNRRASYFWIEGQYYLDTEVQIDLCLRSMDAPNSGTIIIDSVRAAKLALDRRIGGPLTSLSAYAFKNPPVRASILEAQNWFKEFIDGRRER